MNTARMHEILSLLKPDEVRDALRLIDVFQRWAMPVAETDEWRRRIVGRQRFVDLRSDSPLN